MEQLFLSDALQVSIGSGYEFDLSFGILTVRVSAKNVEVSELNTCGSTEIWGDEFWFLKESGKLVKATLHLPEVNTDVTLSDLHIGDSVHSSLVLTTSKHGWVDRPTDVRLWDTSGQYVAALERESLTQLLTLIWLDGAFALTFCNSRYCGWILKNPLLHVGTRAQDDLLDACNRFYKLVTMENVERLTDGDGFMNQDMQALRQQLTQSKRNDPVTNQMIDLLENVLSFFRT